MVVIEFERIPGKSREWLLDHVRAGKDVFREEIEDVGFFAEDAIRDIDLDLDRTTPGQVALAFAHHRDPALPTAFD